jgi:hypothetical protein
MDIPIRNIAGQRQTVNTGLTDNEKVWHFRSAWNVAALNCTAPEYQPILDAYSAYISDHARALKSVNDEIDTRYRQENGGRRPGILAREQQMTAVYNFFALPPARARFCRAVLDIANRALIAPPTDPVAFAMDNFALVQEPFELFFQEYETYQRQSADWDSRYGARYGASQPGWVATQRARARGVVIPSSQGDPAQTLAQPGVQAGAVTDPETGAAVPVVPVRENVISEPIVEPVASEEDEASAAGDTGGPGGQ